MTSSREAVIGTKEEEEFKALLEEKGFFNLRQPLHHALWPDELDMVEKQALKISRSQTTWRKHLLHALLYARVRLSRTKNVDILYTELIRMGWVDQVTMGMLFLQARIERNPELFLRYLGDTRTRGLRINLILQNEWLLFLAQKPCPELESQCVELAPEFAQLLTLLKATSPTECEGIEQINLDSYNLATLFTRSSMGELLLFNYLRQDLRYNSPLFYTAMIDTLVKQKSHSSLHKAEDIFFSAFSKVRPTRLACELLICGWANIGAERCIKSWRRMLKTYRLEPGPRSTRAMIKYYIRRRQVDKAVELIEQLVLPNAAQGKQEWLSFRKVALRWLIAAYQRAGILSELIKWSSIYRDIYGKATCSMHNAILRLSCNPKHKQSIRMLMLWKKEDAALLPKKVDRAKDHPALPRLFHPPPR